MPKTRTNKYKQKSKRSRKRNIKLTKRARKVSNNSTARNKSHKLQYGGAEHINKPSNEMLKRAEERRKALLAKGLPQQQILIPVSVPVAQPLDSVNLEIVKQKIMSASRI